jgi:hypothetical protein
MHSAFTRSLKLEPFTLFLLGRTRLAAARPVDSILASTGTNNTGTPLLTKTVVANAIVDGIVTLEIWDALRINGTLKIGHARKNDARPAHKFASSRTGRSFLDTGIAHNLAASITLAVPNGVQTFASFNGFRVGWARKGTEAPVGSTDAVQNFVPRLARVGNNSNASVSDHVESIQALAISPDAVDAATVPNGLGVGGTLRLRTPFFYTAPV